tara:strand:- start:4483 stop:5037 length:555 start_codon:yes stop_codon:yes gene_type:complete
MSNIEDRFKEASLVITAETDEPDDDIKFDVNEVKGFFYDSIWAMIDDAGVVENRDLITKQANAMIDAIDIGSEDLGYDEIPHEADRWSNSTESHYTEITSVTFSHQARLLFKVKDDTPDDIKALFDHSMAEAMIEDIKENYDFAYSPKEFEYNNQDAPKPKLTPPQKLDNTHQPSVQTPPAPRR